MTRSLLSAVALAANIAVGGTKGWTYGLNTWKPNTPVRAGDVLVFNWKGGHDVWLMKDAPAYKACNFGTAKRKAPMTFGGKYRFPVPVTAKGKTLYFGCGVYGHCAGNMKVAIPIQK
ncbi:hypothetical protein CLOM_g9388 [Closterium sp. NIES-68]|nr:hypothetical protein CLOM_g9388 [Closterium sp. NIES-68]GJP63952.1 hypothetical protein CLOP_g20979 [Closterium sp. NIES-67]GJP64100.1 hypothetical protein CLOP_g21126 [Closterium sp. NIES-67]